MALAGPRNTTAWGIAAANTFRNTSRMLFKGWPQECGTNLQNPSERISELYIPDDGKIFIQADQSGADARIMAYLLPPGNKLRLLYENNIKPHTYIALHLFADYWRGLFSSSTIDTLLGMDISNLSTYPSWKEVSEAIQTDKDANGFELKYFLGKKSIHSFNYKKHPATFIFDILKESEGKIKISLKEGERIYNIYHSLVPELMRYFRDQEKLLRTTRELRNLQGFPRKFYGSFTDAFFREAISFIPQSTVACITNSCFTEIQIIIEDEDYDWDVLNQKHDSVLIQAPIDEMEIAAKFLQICMEQTLTSPYGESFTMKSGIAAGYNWRKYHKEMNPNGMKDIKL